MQYTQLSTEEQITYIKSRIKTLEMDHLAHSMLLETNRKGLEAETGDTPAAEEARRGYQVNIETCERTLRDCEVGITLLNARLAETEPKEAPAPPSKRGR